jgi:hypothetical protein
LIPRHPSGKRQGALGLQHSSKLTQQIPACQEEGERARREGWMISRRGAFEGATSRQSPLQRKQLC